MQRFRFRILDLMLLVAAVGLGTCLWITFRPTPDLAEELVLATYLSLLTTSLVGLWAHRLPPRPFLAGFAAFALGFLVVELRPCGAPDIYRIERCDIGMGYAFLAGVAARWVAPGGWLGPPEAGPAGAEGRG